MQIIMITIFLFLSLSAVVAGGVISAFTARKHTRQSAWLSAYLVLVVGMIQYGLIGCWRGLESPRETMATAAFTLYNLGSIAVIFGTVHKVRFEYSLRIVKSGGFLMGLAVLVLLYAAKDSRASWIFVGLVMLILTVLISMPIGILLSAKRSQELKSGL